MKRISIFSSIIFLLCLGVSATALAGPVKANCLIDGGRSLSIDADTLMPLDKVVSDSTMVEDEKFKLSYQFNPDGVLRNRWSVTLTATHTIEVPSDDPHSDRMITETIIDASIVILKPNQYSNTIELDQTGLQRAICEASAGNTNDFFRYAFQFIDRKALVLTQDLDLIGSGFSTSLTYERYLQNGMIVHLETTLDKTLPYCRLVTELKTWSNIRSATLKAGVFGPIEAGALPSLTASYFLLDGHAVRLYCEKKDDFITLDEFKAAVGDFFRIAPIEEPGPTTLPFTTFNQKWIADNADLAASLNFPVSFTINSAGILIDRNNVNTYMIDGHGNFVSKDLDLADELAWTSLVRFTVNGVANDLHFSNIRDEDRTTFSFNVSLPGDVQVHVIAERTGKILIVESAKAVKTTIACVDNPNDPYHPNCTRTEQTVTYMQ